MILVALCSLVLGGALVYLYFSYKSKDTEVSVPEPPVVYVPKDINENLLNAHKDVYEADLSMAKQIINDLITCEDEEEYQIILKSAYEWLAYREKENG